MAAEDRCAFASTPPGAPLRTLHSTVSGFSTLLDSRVFVLLSLISFVAIATTATPQPPTPSTLYPSWNPPPRIPLPRSTIFLPHDLTLGVENLFLLGRRSGAADESLLQLPFPVLSELSLFSCSTGYARPWRLMVEQHVDPSLRSLMVHGRTTRYDPCDYCVANFALRSTYSLTEGRLLVRVILVQSKRGRWLS